MFLKRILLSFLMFFQTLGWSAPIKEKFYKNQQAWKDLQTRLPEAYQLDENNQPQEYFWQWQKTNVHVDYYPQPNASAKVILLHGVGTNGRQLSLILGHPLAQAGYETMALDLPGYGLTNTHQKVLFVMMIGCNWSVILLMLKHKKINVQFSCMAYLQAACSLCMSQCKINMSKGSLE